MSLVGQVVSNKMQNTLVVCVSDKVKHERYGKYIKRERKLFVHVPDKKIQCKLGDTVLIEQCRPVSKNKAWVLAEVIS